MSDKDIADAWLAASGMAHGCMESPCTICASIEQGRKRLDDLIRADERSRLALMLRAHVSGKSTEHAAGVRYAAALIERGNHKDRA